MTIHFYLQFNTHFGQAIYVSGNSDALGNDDLNQAFAIQYLNNQLWHGTITVDAAKDINTIRYKYILREEGNRAEGRRRQRAARNRVLVRSGEGLSLNFRQCAFCISPFSSSTSASISIEELNEISLITFEPMIRCSVRSIP